MCQEEKTWLNLKKGLDKANKTIYHLITMKEHLINTWPSELTQYQQEIKIFSFNPISGIYFLFRDNKLRYIGKANDIYTRVFTHRRCNRSFDTIYYIHVEKTDLLRVERKLIKHFKPPLNKADNPDRLKPARIQKSKLVKPQKVDRMKYHSRSTKKPANKNVHNLLIASDPEKLMSILNTLTDSEKHIIIKRHGLFNNERMTLQDIADEYNVCRERIRQIQAQAERRLSHPTKVRMLGGRNISELVE